MADRVMCLCSRYCCDTPERDGLRETCRGLPDRPREPLVEVVLVDRWRTVGVPKAVRDEIAEPYQAGGDGWEADEYGATTPASTRKEQL